MPDRIAVLSNCLANQNAKVAEFEVCPGALFPLVGTLREAGYRIVQMPCPEMTFMGCGRWWQSRAQYDTPGYRRHCHALAGSVADILAAEGAHGAEDVVLLGIDGSPSSGVGITSHGPDWGGRPEFRPSSHVHGRGVWIEVLMEVFAERGLPAPRLIGVGTELLGYDAGREIDRVRTFLQSDAREAAAPPVPERKAPPSEKTRIDRSRRILVVGEDAMADAGLCARAEAGGWGFLQLPSARLDAGAHQRALDYVADQVLDYLKHDHEVAAAPGEGAAALDRLLVARRSVPLPVWAG